jgi:two-component system OmpR family response regulator
MNRRIAIVEDDQAIRANYADVLRRSGYEVVVHPDRTSAMQAFRTRLPDLAIVDIGLGEEIDGGFTLCRDLRGLSANCRSSSSRRATRTSTSSRACASAPTTT